MFKVRLISLGACLLLAGCQPPQSQVSPDVANVNRTQGTQIVAFGDSITAGAGVGQQAAYPRLLSEILNVPVVNRGRGGDTTAIALQRLREQSLQADPWLVIVGLGGNDFLQGVPLAQTEENLRQIAIALQQQGVIVVILGMNVEPFNGEYEQLYQRVANDTQAYLIPGVLEGLNDPRYLFDEIHPNSAGHQVLANRIAEGLKPILERPDLPPNSQPPTP
ncbi:GDSL-type esterase/lipase family protein [Kamptonema cortianum]|uniref:GDSL-type esterase/lipase family protein n=1 Tax=Geitlerinema calcuttense NRMC-F 0142 TaxID=2922238 RepID=A0ABT7LXU9_9CYAN|nr:GDSL-type esterase/lipase family protein [Geitlerinema calcuttense]MCD8489394.1 GDSL-type esterase/lipase family protein [Desertifilum sp.]MDK3159270.1 GDSL-type esterase/lipase family protein [Kamptonema cortianum]MDL5056844.1 GDSL-type esterase/lipase family protein [Geitlerinema calcuttense NRMC-F 0142]